MIDKWITGLIRLYQKYISPDTARNSSAIDWLYLNFREPFKLKNLEKITAVNKQLLTKKKLEVFNYPITTQDQNKFEYIFKRRWSL